MKKLSLIAMMVAALFLTGCSLTNAEKGDYKEGTYFASVNGYNGATTAVMYVNENGMIKSLFIDSAHKVDEVATTKKTLGSDYGMKNVSSVKKEWNEQVALIEKRVIKDQNIKFIKIDKESGTMDTVNGVTIRVGDYEKVLKDLLKQAK